VKFIINKNEISFDILYNGGPQVLKAI